MLERLPPVDTRVVRLFGQLGNQMFQFALGRALTPAGLPVPVENSSGDIGMLERAVRPGAIRLMTHREALALRRAPMVGPRRKVQTLLDVQKSAAIRAILDRRIWSDRALGRFDPEVPGRPSPVLYQGYFQHEQYFRNAADQVVGALRPASEQAISLFRAAAGPRSERATVAVHVRAGADYARLGWTPTFEWYRKAAEVATSRLGAVRFIVASDIAFAAEALSAAISDLGPATPMADSAAYDAICALSMADHAILSPSSFSWWAAWLGDYRVDFDAGRVVFAPSFWALPGMEPAPERWTQLA